VACSVYILNFSPTSTLENQFPQEAWSGMKSSVSHFKVFGCVAYAHVSEEMGIKLDDRSEKCIFVGYSEQSKAYRMYNPITKKLRVRRDVKLQEDKSWDNQTSEMIIDHIPFIQEDKQVEATWQLDYPPILPRLQVQGQGEKTEHSSSSPSSNDSIHYRKFEEPKNKKLELNLWAEWWCGSTITLFNAILSMSILWRSNQRRKMGWYNEWRNWSNWNKWHMGSCGSPYR